jgi:surface polysaccharide O-acyltransferase-like enzyme
LFVWSVAFLFYLSYYTGAPLDYLSVLANPTIYHLWFVYMIIGVYLLLPVYQVLFRAIVADRVFKLFFFLVVVFSLLCAYLFFHTFVELVVSKWLFGLWRVLYVGWCHSLF